MDFILKQIGTITTPYNSRAPYQPVDVEKEDFCVEVYDQYAQGLRDLEKFSFMYVLYYAHRVAGEAEMIVAPPWAKGKKVGVFASRSPVRPNPVGLSVVRINYIKDNKVYTSGLDVFNGTPLLDIKPYIKDLDDKKEADYGWLSELDDMDHLTLHIKGIPHEH